MKHVKEGGCSHHLGVTNPLFGCFASFGPIDLGILNLSEHCGKKYLAYANTTGRLFTFRHVWDVLTRQLGLLCYFVFTFSAMVASTSIQPHMLFFNMEYLSKTWFRVHGYRWESEMRVRAARKKRQLARQANMFQTRNVTHSHAKNFYARTVAM